ncbi:MAG: YkgJ family cysteine cluster protein [Proteobacteria bacterium]|nr:YkgJ family cysteine cluster protein [Pseudomonadota bacterium]MBU1639213.1 YkgJ family cysteine cluster protein [Pseudomonadota bacterium]
MSSLREKLLLTIYREFEEWIDRNSLSCACHNGCATCCTQKVTMTAVEGDLIHRFVNEKGRHVWFAEKLKAAKSSLPPMETTNEFAARCLSGEDGFDQYGNDKASVCPYLEENSCQIYSVRPFACRSFASEKKCLPGQAAQLPQYYVSAATAAQQLIEHIGQGEYWGNMHDVLLALCDLKENSVSGDLLPSYSLADQARARLRKAKPLPGFLIGEEDFERVSPLIQAVFHTKIDDKNVEDILNGK